MVISVCLPHDWSDHIWQDWSTHKCYISSGVIFHYEFDGDVWLVFGVTIYGKTSKHTSVIYHLEPFFDTNLIAMFDWYLEWSYMVRPANIQVLYIIWSRFWYEFDSNVWLVFGVTIYGKTGKHTSVIHHLEPFFNAGDVWLMFRVTIYGKTSKHTSVIHHLELFFNMNSIVMFD